jgi:hypothetical protein
MTDEIIYDAVMIIEISLEQIIEACDKTCPEEDLELQYKGIYDDQIERIFYNPLDIVSELDFYLTIVHECCHYWDSADEMSEESIEASAIYICNNDKWVNKFLGFKYEDVIEKYWK